jgi:hypothetical protein
LLCACPSFEGKFGLIPKGPAEAPPLLGEGIRVVVEKGGTLDEANGMMRAGTDTCRPGNSAWMNFARKLTNTWNHTDLLKQSSFYHKLTWWRTN